MNKELLKVMSAIKTADQDTKTVSKEKEKRRKANKQARKQRKANKK